MTKYAGCFLAHNLMLIAFRRYERRQPSLLAYVAILDTLIAYGRTEAGWAKIEALL